jgi:peptidoglycan-associated lipoprotein
MRGASCQTICAVVMAGCLLAFAQGCEKSVQGTSGSKTTEQELASPPKAPVTLPGEERVSDDIVVAKAEPESARQRTQEMQQEAAATAGSGLQDAFFGFDSWTITDGSKQALGADAQWLKANNGKALIIEGHCDERGTQAYNLVLGEKRAKAVRNYLADLGVDTKRLAVASYGKDRPFCREHTEDCYQQNRRGHLVLKAK